ncbi:unnamed protein product, partial [Mesorhabditis spiculigera]
MYKLGRRTRHFVQLGAIVRHEPSIPTPNTTPSSQSDPNSPSYEIKIRRPKFTKQKNSTCSTCSTTSSSGPGTPRSDIVEQQLVDLNQSWKRFNETPNGQPDTSIIVYRSQGSKAEPEFRPFDLDTYYMELILKEVEIDPKLIGF